MPTAMEETTAAGPANTASVTILYGTETGNAAELTKQLSRTCERYGITTKVHEMDHYDLRHILHEKHMIFVCSTTGQGDLPRNCRKLWQFLLRSDLPGNLLAHVRFSTFGLGDSSYAKYNWAIRKLHKRLLQLGASLFAPRGEGDEMSPEGVDRSFMEWQSSLLQHLVKELFGEEDFRRMTPIEKLPPKYPLRVNLLKPKRVTASRIAEIALSRTENDSAKPFGGVFKGTIVENSRMTASDHFQDVRLLSIDPHTQIPVSPGDTVSIYPTTSSEAVNSFLDRFGWRDICDRKVEIPEDYPVPQGGWVSPLTLNSLLTHHLDLMAIPGRSFFDTVAPFASEEREREKLEEFTLLENEEDLFNYTSRPRRSILEVLLEFQSLKLPVEYLLDIIPTLRPRMYSLASPPSSKTLSIAVAIVRYQTIIRKIREGVCTKYISGLSEGAVIPFSIDKTPLKMPQGDSPVICIGPGTGIAPIRSLLLDFRDKNLLGSGPAKNSILFSGFRFKNKDYLFQQDWDTLSQLGLHVYPAFSREKGGYVQDQMYKHKQELFDVLVNQNGSIYLCGSSGKMPRQVKITIETIIEEFMGIEEAKAKDYVNNLELHGRFIQETW